MTPRAVDVLTQAEATSRGLRSRTVAPQHILLGLLAVGEGEGLIALEAAGSPVEGLRQALETPVRQAAGVSREFSLAAALVMG
jgi:hypothetical protein